MPRSPTSARHRVDLLWRRVLAFAIDGLIIVAVGFIVLALLTVALGPSIERPSTGEISLSAWRALVNSSVVAILSAGYFVWSWGRRGATIGQHLIGIRVVTDAAAEVSVGRATLRWALLGGPLGVLGAGLVNAPLAYSLVSAVTGLWIAALLVSTAVSGRRGLHDRVAGTLVERS